MLNLKRQYDRIGVLNWITWAYKESKSEAELLKSEDLSQLEKQEESKINPSSIEELFASNVEKETESNSIKEGKSDQGASKMGEEAMSTWKFLLDIFGFLS